MEKFMLIFHGGRPNLEPEQMQSLMSKWMQWIGKLKQADQYITSERLAPGGKLVSGTNGKSITDGPYTEGKEVVGGFFIVNAKDIDEAAGLAKDFPNYEYGGTVQVRQVMQIDM